MEHNAGHSRVERTFFPSGNKSWQELNESGKRKANSLPVTRQKWIIIKLYLNNFSSSFIFSFRLSLRVFDESEKLIRGNRYLPNIMKNNRKFPPIKKNERETLQK